MKTKDTSLANAAQCAALNDEAQRKTMLDATAVRLIEEGNALEDQGRLQDAMTLYERALTIAPDLARVHLNIGNIHYARGDLDNAIKVYRHALACQPDHAGGHYNLGNALLAAKQFESALAAYDRALALAPEMIDAMVCRAAALEDLGRTRDAESALRLVLSQRPQSVGVWKNLARLFSLARRYEEAAEALEQVMALQPDDPDAQGCWLTARMTACNWSGVEAVRSRLLASIERGCGAASPFQILAHSTSDQLSTNAARQYLASLPSIPPQTVRMRDRVAHQRIRIGYLSADFGNHPVATLLVGMIERHDRARFEIYAWSTGPDDGGAMRQRLMAAFDEFIDVGDVSDAVLAAQIAEAGIDVLVDLTAHTTGGRPGVFAHRAAPVQVNWLGYPGSYGAPWADYLVADRVVVPPEARAHFVEKIAWLPHSYLCDDSRRVIGSPGTRGEAGLPEQGVVFCCFNNTWKIQPKFFSIWLNLLSRIPESVLWLRDHNVNASNNLRARAMEAGVDPARLVFAGSKSAEDHLARHALADLFLDTLPYNAHSTACDALYAGLPVITCRGDSFPGRVASSLLYSAGLPELIAEDLESYEALAIGLARCPERLAKLRLHLMTERTRLPLFDTQAFTRHFEACLLHMVKRSRQGLAPAAFSVRDDGGIEESD